LLPIDSESPVEAIYFILEKKKDMSEKIDSRLQFTQPLQQDQQVRKKGTPGTFHGERVTPRSDTLSPLNNTDALEELTFQFGEKAKRLSDRKKGKPGDKNARALEKAQAYLKKLPDVGRPEKFQQFLEHLKKKGAMSAGQIMDEAKRFFRDVSHQYAGLSYAGEVLEDEGGDPALIHSLKDAVQGLMEEHGPDVRAGMNIGETAFQYSQKDLGEVQELRDFYRDKVLRYEGIHETYVSILSTYGEGKFQDAIAYLIKALGVDLESKGPSVSKEELSLIMDDLYYVEVLGNVYRDCDALIGKMETQFGTKLKASAQELMTRIMDLKTERWLNSDSVMNLVSLSDIRDVRAQIYFLRDLRTLVWNIPEKAYDDPDNRKNLIKAVQDALDTVTYSED
jgi:type III secretion protein W